jgi:hypothetical protein
MIKKRIGYLLLAGVFLFVIPLSGCSGNNPATAEGSADEASTSEYADEAFLADLQTGLYARWDEIKKNEGIEIDISIRAGYAQTELRTIEQYKDGKFENAELGAAANEYIDLLNAQIEQLEGFDQGLNDAKEYNALSDRRDELIKDFVEQFGLVIDGDYIENYNNVIADVGRAFSAETEGHYPYLWMDNECVTIRLPEMTPEEYALRASDSDIRYEYEGWAASYFGPYSGVLKNNTDKEIAVFSENIVVNGIPTEEDFSFFVLTKPGGQSRLNIDFDGQITNISEIHSVDGVLEVRDPKTDEVFGAYPFHFDSLTPIR